MKVQDLIGEVAKRHNVLVDPQDPIFVAVTMNEVLLGEHVDKAQAALARSDKAAEVASARHLETVRQTAASLITESSKRAADEVRAAGFAVRKELQQVAREFVAAAEAAVTEAARQRRSSRRAAIVAIGCAGVVVGMTVATWLGHP